MLATAFGGRHQKKFVRRVDFTSQGGEFAFVLFAVGAIQSVIGEPLVHLIKLAVTLSMAAQSLVFLSTKPSTVPQRQCHLNHIAVGVLKRLAGHKKVKWRCP